MKKLIVLVFALAFVFSCSDNSAQKSVAGKEAQEKAGGAMAPAQGDVLAKVNDVAITMGDVKREFALLPEQLQEIYKTPEGMGSLVEELVKKEMLYQEALKSGYDKEARFEQQMKEFRKRLMIEYLLRKEVEDKAFVSDKDIRAFYDSNRDSFIREVPGEEKSEVIDFERVKDLIRERLMADEQRRVFDEYVEALKGKAKVEMDEAAINKAFGNEVTP